MRIRKQKTWAEGAVIYQIYPRSFQDSNGDGIGDLPGIIQRLDYLKNLGASGIWISPFYPSPMADFGYDVADYLGVDPMFGTMADFKNLLGEAHKRNIKILVDVAPNHTSDEHKWFKASKKSRDNVFSDWYIWKDPRGVHDNQPLPPNNWRDMFSGGSMWKWVPERQQFYLHSFHTKQPDLNWQNPDVHEAIKNVLRFWLDIGVDGFRVDAVPHMGKDPNFRDDPPNPKYKVGKWAPGDANMRVNSGYWPSHFQYIKELSAVLTEKKYLKQPRFMVTEGYPGREDVVGDYMRYFENLNTSVAAPFIFEPIYMKWHASTWRDFLSPFYAAQVASFPGGVPNLAFGNHDQSRLATRLDPIRARAAAVIEFTLPGMVYIYNGEEIGMHDVHIPKEFVQDPGAAGDKKGQGRDPERTPMQWSGDKNAGFSTADITWLPLADDYEVNNVKHQEKDPHSYLFLYKSLIKLRHKNPAISHGSITFDLHATNEILAYTRTKGRKSFTTAVNFAPHATTYTVPRSCKLILSSLPNKKPNRRASGQIHLQANEAIILEHR